MQTPPEREPTDAAGVPPGGSTSSHAPSKDTNVNSETKGSSLIRLTAAPDLLADPPANTDDFPTVITQSPNDLQQPTLAAGARLGNFELMEAIGAGGMATVLKARDLDLGRIVALKILPPATARDGEAVKRFKLEARAAAKLDHENIARVYFCGEDRGLHFIAFEFVEGENLRQQIDRLGRVSPADAVHYLLQLSAGLAHAAERGVIHRDIKPSNILITPDGRAKIVDMGLARHVEGQSFNGGVTQSGVTLGTFDYISPEQALDPRRADIRSDIYSLGCAFYHALTGRPPVPEGTAAKKLYAHEHEFPTDPRDLNPAVPDGLAIVLAKMMAKRPAQRYQTPAELAHDLGLLALAAKPDLSGVSALSATAVGLVPPARPLPRVPLVWVTAVALVAVAVILYVGWGPPPSPSAVAPWQQESGGKKADPVVPNPHAGPAAPVEPRATRLADARALSESIAKQGDKVAVQLQPGTTYDLTGGDGILFTGSELVVEPEPSTRAEFVRPVLRIAAAPPGEKALRPGTLTCRDVTGRVLFRGVEIQIADRPVGAEQPDEDPVGLQLTNVARAEFENCLVHSSPDGRRQRAVGGAVDRDARGKAGSFALRHSVVDVGLLGVGLRVVERTDVELTEAGFGPHQAAVECADDAEDGAADPRPLALRSCTFMLDRGGAAVAVDPRAACALAVSACVFAEATVPDEKLMMPGMGSPASPPVVVRSDAGPDAVRVQASAGPNAYYRVAPPAGDPRAVVLSASPWAASDPRPHLASGNPWAAFQLNLNDKRLRAAPPYHVVGLTAVERPDRTSRPIYDGPWPPERPTLPVKAKDNQRVVHPDAEPEHAKARIYPTVAKAFEDMKPGETLLIAQNGKVPVAVLAEKTVRATVAAFDGFSPVLVPSDDVLRRPDASLFPLVDGELTLLGLHVQLGSRSAVVSMAGGTTCTFKNCNITLDEKDDEPPLSAVLLTEPAREMKTGAAEPANPQLRMENTFVHGRGKVVALRAPRPFDWAAENAAFVVDGSVLQSDAAARDGAVPRGALRWKNVTVATTGPAFDLRGGSARTLGLDVTADRCVLTSAKRRNVPPMVLFEDADGTTDPAAALTWRGDGMNVYGNFDPVVEVRPTGAARSAEWDAQKWLRFTGEAGRLATVRFASSLSAMKLRNLKPDDVRAEIETADSALWRAADAGVDTTKLLKPVERAAAEK